MAATETGSEHLRLSIDDGVAVLTIDNAADRNRLTPAAMAVLGALAEQLRGRDDVNCLVITAVGEVFSMGLLNPTLREAMSKDDVVGFVLAANRVFDAIEALPQVVVCGINGPLRAGAAELAMACDIRYVADHATLTLPEAGWGGFPGAGAPVRLPGLIGHGRALQLICTGRTIDAQEMLRYGFADEVVPVAELPQAVLALARAIADAGPLATRGAKRIMRLRQEPGLRAARELSDALRQALEWSHDVDEGSAAFREGRKPRFTGR
jgi:enoyl-CoA hydratase/carnithine racemase